MRAKSASGNETNEKANFIFACSWYKNAPKPDTWSNSKVKR